MSVSLAKLTGTRMVIETGLGWYGADWNYAEFCASVHDAYEMREMSGSFESVSFSTYLGILTEIVRPGAADGDPLQRAHCTAMSVMFEDMLSRIDRECDELSALLNSDIWNETVEPEVPGMHFTYGDE